MLAPQMSKDLTIGGFDDRPGINAAIGEALDRAGINIGGTFSSARHREIHVLVDDAEGARAAIEEAGFEVTDERDVLVLDIEDEPGAWGEIARRLAEQGVNIDFDYLATGNRVVIGVDDLDKARSALQ